MTRCSQFRRNQLVDVTDSGVNPLHVFSDWRTEYVSDGRTLDGFFVAPDGEGPIQACDDVHLTPTYVLGGELAALEKQHETRIYQPLGTERGNGHGVFNKAVDLWSPDVRRFLARWV